MSVHEGGHQQAEPTCPISSIHLERLHMVAFGSASDKTIGPFSPTMNVVYGKNESGKTTINAFFGGVLFGWEGAHGGKNTYKPQNAERAGSLFFANGEDGAEYELARSKNSEGLQGDADLIDDIDKETFQTMFALTSDELRSLKNTTDVTAKLLTAGSGTGASPSQAQEELQRRIAEHTSRAANCEHSLVLLRAQLETLRQEVAQAADAADRHRHLDKEFHEIEPQRNALLNKLKAVNAELESLSADKASIEKLDEELDRNLAKRKDLLEEEAVLVTEQRLHRDAANNAIADLNPDSEAVIRGRIDSLVEEDSRRRHGVTLAEDNLMVSKANYEALLEADDLQERDRKSRKQRKTQIALSIILPFLFILAGVPVFLHGREISSLSFTALGLIFIVFALFLGGAALVMLFRPDKAEEERDQRKQDLQWVMLQDKKKLEAVEETLQAHERQARAYLDSVGLGAADGSLKQARSILDESKDARAESDLFVQRQQALLAQLSSVEEAITETQSKKEAIHRRLSLPAEADIQDIAALIDEKASKRSGLLEMSENINRRYGELKQELSQAQHQTRFDEAKLEFQQVKTRIEDSETDLARLLLAKHMLGAAISAWESKSQPEVYRRASRLLSLMTAGKWVQVKMTEEGKLQVIDNVKKKRDPVHLSLGTCQQLYLSLRIALLMTADNVGRAIPIMADDILVNFDEERRKGAADALKELSERRQVIFFTSHRDIVRLMQDADPRLNLIEL